MAEVYRRRQHEKAGQHVLRERGQETDESPAGAGVPEKVNNGVLLEADDEVDEAPRLLRLVHTADRGNLTGILCLQI